MGKVYSLDQLIILRRQWKRDEKKVVFTNGCFDIIHRGHIDYLTRAKKLGDVLIVALNTDESVHRLKGRKRPIVPLEDRAEVMAALETVDAVCAFNEDTPYEIIKALIPDILVKGGDWKTDAIVGKEIVESNGGVVRSLNFLPGRSTTNIIKKILEAYTDEN